MVTAAPASATGAQAARPLSPAKSRIIAAALDLFAEYGVSGTSLQMIADYIGVTKAAIYHQFKTKDEIVLATVDAELAHLQVALEAAEAEPSSERGRELLLEQVIDIAVKRRGQTSALQNDPVVIRFLAEHAPFAELMDRLYRVLLGADSDPEASIAAAMTAGAIGGAVAHPLVAELDDDVLRTQLLRIARRLLGLPERPSSTPRISRNRR
jgi:AcrR family transcriptional regulator